MKIFRDTGLMEQSAHFGWQDKDLALWGLREGYKNSADELVAIALNNGYNPKTLDTFIFPILFLYRHSIELTLKHIYQRCFGQIPNCKHDLLGLWDLIRSDVIDNLICSKQYIETVKSYKTNFINYSVEGINFNQIRLLIIELQEANQHQNEIKKNNRQADYNAEVWRYLISNDELFFTSSHSIDYVNLQESIHYIYDVLDFIYSIVDDYLST